MRRRQSPSEANKTNVMDCASEAVLDWVGGSRGGLNDRYDMKYWRSIYRTGDGWRKAEKKAMTSGGLGASISAGSIAKKYGKPTANWRGRGLMKSRSIILCRNWSAYAGCNVWEPLDILWCCIRCRKWCFLGPNIREKSSKLKAAYIFPCLDCTFVIGRLIEDLSATNKPINQSSAGIFSQLIGL